VASVVERYVLAVLAFVAAAVWLGVGLIHGFACLFAFVLTFQAVRLYQRRSDSKSRRTRISHERRSRDKLAVTQERDVSTAARRGGRRSIPSGRVYDGDLEESDWPVSREARW
jgi:hypothetical protein